MMGREASGKSCFESGPREELPVTVTDGEELIAGRYRLISQVGRGAMGVVWRARDERLGRTVAVKQLRAPIGMSSTQIDQAQLRARREARIAARLQHENAVGIYDVVEHDGRPCLVMEYVPSSSLSEVLAEGDGLTPDEVAAMGAQLASALVAAHEAGIVHRDIKPGNILMPESGPVKLTDFGISRATGDVTITGTGEMLGTPAFTSPEVAQGRTATAASDVFSLGATLYAALEGTPPFGMGPNVVALLLRIVNDEIRPPQHSGALMNTLLWMMRHEPAERPSMREVKQELESATTATLVTSPVTSDEDGAEEPGDVPEAAAAPESVEQTDEPGPSPSPLPVGQKAEPAQSQPRRPSRVRARLRARLPIIVVLALVGLLTAGIVAAITANNHPGSPNAAPAPTRTPISRTSSRPGTPTPSVSTGGVVGKSASPTPSATATVSVAAQLSSRITQYYGLVPGNLDEAWGFMTADYQQNHAGGPKGYRDFWDQIQRVSISDLVVESPSTVVVTIEYYYKNGQDVRERTSFGMVKQNGAWEIASSTVLSSK
jgi:eukaryotic-like serine/threonine-protein kinase